MFTLVTRNFDFFSGRSQLLCSYKTAMLEKLSHSPHALTYSKHMFNPKFLSWLNAHAGDSFSSCNQAATAESKLQNHSTVTLYVLQEMLSIKKTRQWKEFFSFFFFVLSRIFVFGSETRADSLGSQTALCVVYSKLWLALISRCCSRILMILYKLFLVYCS